MKFRQALAIVVLATGLGACATYYDDGVQYDDGSYYSPPEDGEGDYYFAPQPRYYHHYDYHNDWFFGWPYYGPYGSWYGSPFYQYDGGCSVRYRYCPAYGYDDFPRFGLSIQFYDPWYYGRYPSDGDGYGGGYYGGGYYGGGAYYGGGYGYGHHHGYRRGHGHGDHRGPPRSRQPDDAPAPATPAPPGDAPIAQTPADQDGGASPDENLPPPRRLPRRAPRAAPAPPIDGPAEDAPLGTVATNAPETPEAAEVPIRRWRGPTRPTAGDPAPAPRARAPAPSSTPAPAPRRAAAPEPSTSSSDGGDDIPSKYSRRGRDADGRN